MTTQTRAAVLTAPAFLGHETGDHPENPRRLDAILAALSEDDLLGGRPPISFRPATAEMVGRVHVGGYLDRLLGWAAAGGGLIGPDTVLRPDSVDAALLASGAAVALVDAALAGTAPRGIVLSRPPGHHATPDQAMGFCLLNHVAIAAAHAVAQGVPRVFVLDWDVHHGNGTQDAFYGDDRVFFCSIHQWPLYPMTGRADERGAGSGRGYTLNLPQPPGRTDADYLALFERSIAPAMRAFRPDFVLVSAGYDAHAADPLGGMALTAAGFGALARAVVATAEDLCDGRVVAVLEGGYDPPATAASVVETIRALDGQAPSRPD